MQDFIGGQSLVTIGKKLRPLSRAKYTSRQTDKPSNEHICQISTKFWKVINCHIVITMVGLMLYLQKARGISRR